ncbi:MAG TPA: sigma 54-interacting transcriptional regulator [Bacteroidota bacterium]|nr:sigma 54-interacting transcriptional regulator [Bacteroidota bacterium]
MTQELRLVGTSSFAKRIVKQVAKLGPGREDVFIMGEAGSGRRTVAWEIHNAKGRKKPYVLIDARSMTTEEIRATFTGQDLESAESLAGRKPAAISDNATVTVADADLLAPHNQALVSSFLKEGRRKFGGIKVIVTTQQPLERLAQSGVFAADLVGHLEKFESVEVPPLRERVEDIPSLTTSIAKQLCASLGKPMKEISPNTSHILSQGQWPGNLQQLVAVIGKAVMISHGDNLELPPDFLDEHQHLADAIANIHSGRIFILDQSLDLIEKLIIQRALKHFMYNQSRTAQVFGLSEANFRYRLKKFGLPSIRKKV